MAIIAAYESDDLIYGLLCEWLGGAGHVMGDLTRTHDRRRPPADLVIVSVSGQRREIDLMMHCVRSVHPGAPIVALSSHARLGLSSNGALARELGVARVMAKPLARRALLGAVNDVLAGV